MLVASGVEFSGEREFAGEFPPVIGTIQMVAGGVTIERASCIAVQIAVGDPVCQDDVIETAADGRIGIRFIDGTVFNLSGDARVVLGEFICESDGTSRSASLTVTRGTFAFVAGQLAKSGALSVDTPFGSIRSRTLAGGFGMLSLAALTFAMMKEVQAADPNVTLLDDDNITYKHFDHGVFELVTKEPIPRHIIVEDPGETIVLNRIGSSVSVNQVANSAARMDELQVAQQDALANFAKGFGHTGSSAYPFLSPEELPQPINFIQPDEPAAQEALPVILPATFTVPDSLIVRVPPPPPPPPPTLEITGIAGQIGVTTNNIINASQANAGVQITGTTSGVENGRIVAITITDSSNHVVYSNTATVTNNTWLIQVSPADAKALGDGIYTVIADVSNAAGSSAEASHEIRVDETPPTIAIDGIGHNNVVNTNVASAGFAITGTVLDAENGQPVTVKIVDSSGHVVDTFATTLANNAWSVNITSTDAKLLHDGSYTVTADVSDTAGNPAPEATQAITVDETPPTVTWLPQAESGVEGTTIALGRITATPNSLPGHSDNVQSLVVSGIPVGAVLTDCANSFLATSGNTSIDVKSWNLSNLKIIPPNDTNFILTVTATDQDANTASASELVTVTPLPPDVDPVAAHGNEDTAIALNLGVTARSLSGANGDTSPNSLDTLVVSDIPLGATLSDGTGLPSHSFTATADNSSHDVASWNLSSLKITPPAEFEGCFTLTIAATERDSEGNISATATATEVVTVAPVAEPPTAKAPATLTLNENATGVAVAGVSVGPPAEDSDDTVRATLTVSHGTLHVGSLDGVTVTGDDCATLSLSGSAAAVNTLLAGLNYRPITGYEGSDTLHLSVTSSDGSNTYPMAATASTAIAVNPVAEPPTASAPEALTLNEDATGVAVAGVKVGPPAEDNDDTVSATLTVSHGTLHVGSPGGVMMSGDDSATLTLSGSAAAVNTLLAGLTYAPTNEYEGSDTLHLSVTSSDGSNTYPTAATASTAITVRPVADPPTASAPARLTLSEDAIGVAVAGVSVGPLAEDNDDTVSATLTVSHGTLHVGSLGGVTVSGDDCATLTLSGSAAAVNTLLAGLTYTPNDEYDGSDALHLSVTSRDGANTYPTQATAATAITVIENSESLIVGGPGPTLDWNNPANWSRGFIPTLGTDVTINAPSNYTVVITGTPDAQAASLTIPHGAASTDIKVSGTLQLDGDINISDSGKLENDGTLEEAANATFTGPITNNGTIIVDPNVGLDVTGTITGSGKFWINSGATLEFALGSKVAPGTTDSQTIYFEQGAGKLVIDDWGKFAGVITGTDIGTHLTLTDLIDLTQLPYVGGSMSVSVAYNSGTNISTMTFSDGISANNVTLHLSGNYTGASWTFTSIDGGAGTEIRDPPADSGIMTSSMVETGGATPGTPIATGTPTDNEVDIRPNTITTARPPTNSASGTGTFTMTAAGVWTYTLDSSASVVNAFNTDNTLTGIFSVTAIGGTTQAVTADSNAAQFKTITDFVSGSEKIDLTALGALDSAVLALTPTGASVPAHTIAWRADSGANETIVYVNPTDQALSIGSSGLLEIHVQGITTLHASDFVLAPAMETTVVAAGDPLDPAITTHNDATVVATTTTDVSSDTTVSKALLADWNGTAQTTNISDSFDATRDHIHSIDHVKLASLDQGVTPAKDSADGAVTTLPAGPSIELPHVTVTAPMQTGSILDQKPVLDSTAATTVNHGAETNSPTPAAGGAIVPSNSDEKVNSGKNSVDNDDDGGVPPKDAGSVEADHHAHTNDIGSEIVFNQAHLQAHLNASERGDDNRWITSEASEHDASPKHDAGVHGIEPSSTAHEVFEGTAGGHGDSFHFKDEILGLKGSGVIDVAEPDPIPASVSHHEDAGEAHGSPVTSEEGGNAGTPGDSFHFKDKIPGSKGSAVIDLTELDHVPASIDHPERAAGAHGSPALAEGAHATELPLPEQHPDDPFHVVANHAGVTHVHHDLVL
ncbi:VCBS domain-containing protein [Bradyrhizobium sp. NP1]|uniref:VCBS domain-containing protein n=1 Tax=Bradyrhizobium sp. NP1 TaxID=3049772 RepID=UPI0025A5DCD0|nr:VCBS domain-containing protein [Bradyrhizobium sp. NP1]WJR76000.1 VCBS domain-containing protein [Bradyrhizobium sp. NP1]